MEEKISFEHRLTEVTERSKSNTKRIDEIEKRQENLDKLTSSVAVLAEQEKRVEHDVKEIKADVKTLTEKPAKRWEGAVEKVIYGIIGAIVAWLLGGGSIG